LNHHGARRDEPAPRIERLCPRKHDVPGDEELVKAPTLRRGEHGGERTEMAVNIGKAEEAQSRALFFGA
jgi:hypothetical protein